MSQFRAEITSEDGSVDFVECEVDENLGRDHVEASVIMPMIHALLDTFLSKNG